jgi:hypothetical protein
VTNRQIWHVSWLAKILLLAVSLVFVTALGEMTLRMLGRYQPAPYPPHNLRPGLIEAYPPYGYRLIPSRRTTYLYPRNSPHPRTITIVSNRDGFRSSRELDEPDSRPRAVFLGDSQLFGDGVEEPERLTEVLATMRPSWRIDNLGMVGWGPDLMLRSLLVVGLKLKPSLVVLCLSTDSIRRVRPEFSGTGFLIPRYKLSFGHLVSVPYPTPTFWNQLRISVAVNNYLWNRLWQWDLDEAILDRFGELAEQQPFQKAIIFLPGTLDTETDQKRRFWLGHYASRHATAFLDLSDPIHKMGDQAFIERDQHLSPAGHQLVARELDRFLSERIKPLN